MRKMLAGLLAGVLLLSGCTAQAAAKSDDTAAVAQVEAGQQMTNGCLSAPRRADKRHGLSFFHRKMNIGERFCTGTAVSERYMVKCHFFI